MEPNLWVGNEPNPDDRLKLRVSDDDRNAIDRTRGIANMRVTVTDLNSGKKYVLRRASCGLPRCICALELVRKAK